MSATAPPAEVADPAKQSSPKNLRCDDDLWAAYGALCKERDTTISQSLRAHMRAEVAKAARTPATRRRTR